MIGIIFVYSFVAGACYTVSHGALLADKKINDKYTWINRPLSLILGLVWPLIFLAFIARKLVK